MPFVNPSPQNKDSIARNLIGKGTYLIAHLPGNGSSMVIHRGLSRKHLRFLAEWCEAEMKKRGEFGDAG